LSIAHGWEGRVLLESVADSVDFYTQQCHFSVVGERHPTKSSAMELGAEGAKRLLGL